MASFSGQSARRGRLREDHALLWLLTGFALLAFSLFEGALRFMADLIGVVYVRSILFGIGMMFAVVILLFQGITINRACRRRTRNWRRTSRTLAWQVQQWQIANQTGSRTDVAPADDLVEGVVGDAVGDRNCA